MQFTSPETGKRRYILIGTAKIGKSGDFSIKEAREKAQELKKLIRAGADPVEQRIRDTKAEVAAASEEADQTARDIAGSVDALFQLYLADLKIGELEMSGKKVVNVDKNKKISKDAVRLNDVFSMDMTTGRTQETLFQQPAGQWLDIFLIERQGVRQFFHPIAGLFSKYLILLRLNAQSVKH